MSDKLRAAALAVLEVLYEDCAFAAHTLRAALAEPEQEPVGKFSKFSDGVWKEVTASSPGMLLYSAPPRREWVGLTDDEINAIEFPQSGTATMRDFVRIIEAKLREKNT